MAPPSSGRKKRVPAWVWGVGAVIVMLMAGAALVASGVLSLPGQQAAPPPPTAAQQPASVPPASVEPVTILLGREEVWQTVNADQEIYVEWVWGVCDSSLLHDNLDALDFKLTIDGQMAAQGKMAEYRTQLLQEDKDGVRIFWQHYAYSLGGFRSGSVHWVDLDRGFFRDVTDGCDLDGDGGLDWYGRDSTLTTTAHLIVR